MGLVLGSIVGMVWMVSANREYRDKMPEPHRFFPSRKYGALAVVCVRGVELTMAQLEQADYRA